MVVQFRDIGSMWSTSRSNAYPSGYDCQLVKLKRFVFLVVGGGGNGNRH